MKGSYFAYVRAASIHLTKATLPSGPQRWTENVHVLFPPFKPSLLMLPVFRFLFGGRRLPLSDCDPRLTFALETLTREDKSLREEEAASWCVTAIPAMACDGHTGYGVGFGAKLSLALANIFGRIMYRTTALPIIMFCPSNCLLLYTSVGSPEAKLSSLISSYCC